MWRCRAARSSASVSSWRGTFCNKLWNASRFALMNLEGYTPAPVADAELAIEDRWVLSRLATVTEQVTAALEAYHFADAARALYDFAWNEFCSFYVEMVKGRLQDPAARPVAQRVLAHTLDVLLRLLHPLVPFITEESGNCSTRRRPSGGCERASRRRERDDRPLAGCGCGPQDSEIEARLPGSSRYWQACANSQPAKHSSENADPVRGANGRRHA